VLTTAPYVFAELLGGYTDLDSAISSGRVQVAGSKREARRFFRIFHLPTAATDGRSGGWNGQVSTRRSFQ
jgi:hypothetical protein